MKKIIVAVLALLGATAVFARERIAVFPFEDMDNVFTHNEATLFYREFSNEYTNRSAGKFSVVPRLEVERLINIEADFQLSAFSAQIKTAEMQKVLNGTRILSGIIGRVDDTIRITVSLYTYPELNQLPGGTTLSVSNKNELFNKIPELVQKMQSVQTGQKSGANTTKDPRLGIALGNIFFGLGSYISGDWAGGLIVTGGYLAAGGLILWEIYGLEYEDSAAGVIGPVGIGIGGVSLVYGIARPYLRSRNRRFAYLSDNFNIAIVPARDSIIAMNVSYNIKW